MHALIDRLAEKAFESGATDLFLSEGEVPRIRLDNVITPLDHPAVPRETMETFWRSCHADPETTTEKDISHVIPEGKRLRVNLYRSLGLLAAVLRPIKNEIPSLTELGLPENLITQWFNQNAGFILVTGPTGSGKSTTVASALQWVNHHLTKHIVTIEDPIEYLFANQHSYFSQRELHADTPSFGSALRASMRQSPDIIFVGEIRDEETAKVCLQAAETGHLVVATLHSSGVTDSLERLSNLFPAEERSGLLKLLSQHLTGILSQQLLPRSEEGLFLAIEHLQNEAGTRKWIEEANLAEISDHMNRGDNAANCSFVRYLVAASEQGFISAEVARKASPNAQDFDRFLRGIS
ncbi:PilT/PilU family type 4a pilus ATPase [Verrucomicrobiaceae bacterium N1E253]|uniref:PilT/PilU family type 4a pilus ATPase n=1 Tax=Oceaniferula marina TaxID=2748318 RepID=A0A851GPC8_9BACT|nr:PilT/PilU family type 4a pilus ATPase [Oceaniferula marina]NWK56877.1 PilT/PilU family type 4a pilus ATPase [Oceaniferula marina]